MRNLKCTECGQEFNDGMGECPNCGCPASECMVIHENNTVEAVTYDGSIYSILQKDLAHYFIYEGAVLFWRAFSGKYLSFKGRATRREFWSFVATELWFVLFSLFGGVLAYVVILVAFPALLSILVRRLHDINKNGWWVLVPFICFFFACKKSDEGVNKYGVPSKYII